MNEDPTAQSKQRVSQKSAKKDIQLANDIEVAGDDYQIPHINFACSRFLTPRNVIRIANENKGIETYAITDVKDLVTSKLNEVLDAQEDNMRKILK